MQRFYALNFMRRYERMFERLVAEQLMAWVFDRPASAILEVAAEWSALQRPRQSRVLDELRDSMYACLQQRIDQLPSCFTRCGDSSS